jgi:hypothetical protein
LTDDEILAAVRASVHSVWSMELLTLMMRDPRRTWNPEALVRELRASGAAISEALRDLLAAGLVGSMPDGSYVFAPNSPTVAETATGIARLYAEKPTMIIKEILSAPNDKIRTFADAFRFRK